MKQLLWYSPQSLLRNRKEKLNLLRTLLVLYDHLLEALEQFYVHRRYHFFDPHVGDNLCQVRACQLVLLALDAPIMHREINFLFASKKKLLEKLFWFQKKISESNSQNQVLDDSVPSEKFLNQLDINFIIPEKIIFVYESYFLTKYKEFTEERRGAFIDRKETAKKLKFSEQLTNNIILDLQRRLCVKTCNFVCENLPKSFLNSLPLELSFYCKEDILQRPMFPFYYSTLAVVHVVREKKILNCFVVNSKDSKCRFPCYVLGKDFLFEETLPINDQPLLLWEGWSSFYNGSNEKNWKKKFSMVDPWELVLANVAYHRQYVDSIKFMPRESYGPNFLLQ